MMSPWIVSTLAMGFATGGAAVCATVVARGESSASIQTSVRARIENEDLLMKPPEDSWRAETRNRRWPQMAAAASRCTDSPMRDEKYQVLLMPTRELTQLS